MTNSLPTFEQPDRTLWDRLGDWAGTSLSRMGLPLAPLTEESLLSAAQGQTNLSDWGDEEFRVALGILLKSLDEEANLNFFGRSRMRDMCIGLLANRLRMQSDFKRYGEILDVPIVRPLFILGLPRTGSTLLHNLLSQDPTNRWLRQWEVMSPSPPPDSQTRENDPRISAAQQYVQWANAKIPKLAIAHELNPTGPAECIRLLAHGFVTYSFLTRANLPSYRDWLQKQDMIAPYRYYRQQLQLLGWRDRGERWLLKAPVHLYCLDALMRVFPDARIIQTHRDPLKVVPSVCSLLALVRGTDTNHVDLKALGEQSLKALGKGMDHGIKVRETADPGQFYDLYYSDLVRDPIATVGQIYSYFGYDLTPTMEENMKGWLSSHRQHKHGIHRYSLEQFGLDAKVVNDKFANYRTRFNILPE